MALLYYVPTELIVRQRYNQITGNFVFLRGYKMANHDGRNSRIHHKIHLKSTFPLLSFEKNISLGHSNAMQCNRILVITTHVPTGTRWHKILCLWVQMSLISGHDLPLNNCLPTVLLAAKELFFIVLPFFLFP